MSTFSDMSTHSAPFFLPISLAVRKFVRIFAAIFICIMAVTNVYPETVETHLYWNLLKDLSETVRMQLVLKLKDSLLSKAPSSVDEGAQVAYYAILDKLKTYQGYEKGWDGEQASPLTEKVVSNFSHVLETIDKKLLEGITIFPETNGTLMIDSTRREAGISLGDDKFSYYVIDGDVVKGENGVPFTVSALTNIIKEIND